MRHRNRNSVAQALRDLQSLIPRPWDVDIFVAALAAVRGRPIILLPWDLPDGLDKPNGYWIPAETADYIVYQRTAPAARRDTIITHELAHMVLGHTAQLATDDVAALLAPSIDSGIALRLLARHGYEEKSEAAAESLATLLVAGRMDHDRGRLSRTSDQTTELGRLTHGLR